MREDVIMAVICTILFLFVIVFYYVTTDDKMMVEATTEAVREIVTTEQVTEMPTEVVTEEPIEDVFDEKIIFISERKTAVRSASSIDNSIGSIDENGYGWVQLQYSAEYNIMDAHLVQSDESIEVFGHTETWCNITDCVIPDRHIADDGTVRDEDGFIAVASNRQLYSIVMTSIGPGKVYKKIADDVIRVYTNWK